ncbi:uncharacterized protein BDV14DRAFT_37050 [Aspergillus stella-maris]|uniref:uncharacterized protein n=1 Tax=Aspergillus stella-maris TaxID=1810926 RepID=UPI003CCD351A
MDDEAEISVLGVAKRSKRRVKGRGCSSVMLHCIQHGLCLIAVLVLLTCRFSHPTNPCMSEATPSILYECRHGASGGKRIDYLVFKTQAFTTSLVPGQRINGFGTNRRQCPNGSFVECQTGNLLLFDVVSKFQFELLRGQT